MALCAVALAIAAIISSSNAQVPAGVPQYVLDHAPIVYLHGQDRYRPSDIAATLDNTIPLANFDSMENVPNPLTLSNLDVLNSRPKPQDVFLTNKFNMATSSRWLDGVQPDSQGITKNATSCVTVVVDKGDGVVDAFYIYWFAYNWGGVLFGQEIGNHVGDWEHNAIRFKDGVAQQIWYSQHGGGKAYTYDATDKEGRRPLSYAANGTHAVYALPGLHDRAIPKSPLPGLFFNDEAAKDIRWDPIASSYFVKYDVKTSKFSAYDATTPLAWLDFAGRWGDKQYSNTDPRQKSIFNLKTGWKYVSGPAGVRDKRLERKSICLDYKKCPVYKDIVRRDTDEEEEDGQGED